MMKIFSIVGARPQFIKAAMLSKHFSDQENVREVVLHTGQHYDANMSDIFFQELEMPTPTYNLGIHQPTHGAMTGEMLIEIEKALIKESPDIVVVYGDTDSTLAGALAASKLHIPVAHVEAGLRSFNRKMPEEINRVVTDHVSELLFAPTPTAVANLTAENRPKSSIMHSGDIMFDAALQAYTSVDPSEVLKSYNIAPKAYTLVTLHRAENTDDRNRLPIWMDALEEAARDIPVIFPLHPRTKQRIVDHQMKLSDYPSIHFIDPVGYATMAVLTKNARLVATDSGGLQKEAYFHQVPGLILRNETEWVELVDCKWSALVDCSKEMLLRSFRDFGRPEKWDPELFGTGKTAQLIAQTIINYLK